MTGAETQDEYFPGDTYVTPETTRRFLGDRLSFGTSLWFRLQIFRIVMRSRSLAVRGLYDDEQWNRNSHSVFRTIEGCGGRFFISGLDNLRKTGDPVVIISNHMSTLETFVFPALINPIKPVTFVVKDSLVRVKVFGPIMRSRNPVVVGRTNSRHDLLTVLQEGEKILKSGRSIIIFPQATRRIRFNPEHFNSLGIKLAKRAGVNVVPAAIKTDSWKIGRWVRDLGGLDRKQPIYIHFGEEFAIEGNGRQQHEFTVRFIQDHLKKWQNN